MPPDVLFQECGEPDGAEDTLAYIKSGSYREAAKAHTQWVIGARESIETCNSRLRSIKSFLESIGE